MRNERLSWALDSPGANDESEPDLSFRARRIPTAASPTTHKHPSSRCRGRGFLAAGLQSPNAGLQAFHQHRVMSVIALEVHQGGDEPGQGVAALAGQVDFRFLHFQAAGKELGPRRTYRV